MWIVVHLDAVLGNNDAPAAAKSDNGVVPFRTRSSQGEAPASPERLFDDLIKTGDGVGALWTHQTDLLRAYSDRHVGHANVALELPTGAGKTLPGLLIAEWRRRSRAERVLYACPNHQLVDQVRDAAVANGISPAVLVGPKSSWDARDKAAYSGNEQIGLTTYSALFNAKPGMSKPHVIIFDDAHSAEGFVAANWSVEVSRRHLGSTYQSLLQILEPGLPSTVFSAFLDDNDAHIGSEAPRLTPVNISAGLADSLAGVLARLDPDDDDQKTAYWGFVKIRTFLDKCLIYVGRNRILIRPFIPPTGQNGHFKDAIQRIYLSATLGDSGELERSFGVAPIERLPVPSGWEKRGAGRRFFLFASLQRGRSAAAFTGDVALLARKSVVLSPSTHAANKVAEIVPKGLPLFGPSQPETALISFRSATRGILALAGRYDGIDLPGEQCRAVILDGLPKGAHLQEQFLSDSLLAGVVLQERVRTRIIQGAGRATRGLSDHSLVVLKGDDITEFLALREVQSALRSELQAEIAFGLQNSAARAEELLENAEIFLAQGDEWRSQAEPEIIERRTEATQSRPTVAQPLSKAAGYEIEACESLLAGDWRHAAEAAMKVVEQVPGNELRGYRGFWLYLAAAWTREADKQQGERSITPAVLATLRKAHAAARGSLWLREVMPLPEEEVVLDDQVDVEAISAALASRFITQATGAFTKFVADMERNLGQTEASAYENGLRSLGELLGVRAFKSKDQARPDCVWMLPSWWLTFEAKTEDKAEGDVDVWDIRQARDHLELTAADEGVEIPEGSASLVVSPRPLIHPDAATVAPEHLYYVTPATVLALSRDVAAAWRDIRASPNRDDAFGVVARAFAARNVLASDAQARLLQTRVQG
ncbi:DEAD/DEAH box helicase [Angustibacter speluncae]